MGRFWKIEGVEWFVEPGVIVAGIVGLTKRRLAGEDVLQSVNQFLQLMSHAVFPYPW